MLTELRIINFRSLRNLSVRGLTRVSLLVGANNAGKTSVLEAAELVLGGTTAGVIATSPMRRGEVSFRIEDDGVGRRREIELNHLFSGHDLAPGTFLQVEAAASGKRFFSCQVVPTAEIRTALDDVPPVVLGEKFTLTESSLSLRIEGDRLSPTILPLRDQSFPMTSLRPAAPAKTGQGNEWRVNFVETTTPTTGRIRTYWDEVVLTPEEARVIEVLQIIEPTIERIAAVTGIGSRLESSIFIKLKDSPQRVPLGSMGEGIKRLLSLSLNLVNSAGGYLLVDEIDTGLHHSVMVKMWRLVVEAAKRLNVQVLATTHSLDCVRALAALYEEHSEVRDLISLHRIERNAELSTTYSADEILAAAQHQMEVR